MQILKLDRPPGFTLVELLVSMGIGLAVLAAVAGTFIAQSKYLNAQEQINEMQQNARAAMDIMVREIKMAGYPASGTFCGVPYSTSQLEIKADLDGSGSITSNSNEDIIYSYDSTEKQILRNSVPLADNIESFTFGYLKADGTSTTDPEQIWQVSVSITAKTAKPDPNYSTNNGYRTYQVTASITPPNLAINQDGC